MKMNIAIASSKEYAYYNKVLLLSLFKNNANHEFKVYYGYTEDETLEIIKQLNEWALEYGADIIPIKIDCNKYKVMFPRYMKNIACIRHMLYWMLPEQVDRIMYISSDMLVLGDISEFYNIDLNGKIIAGTMTTEKYESKQNLKEHWEKYRKWNIKRELPCIDTELMNAELLVVDVKMLKEKVNIEEYIDFIGNKELPMTDEQALNIIFRDNKVMIEQIQYGVWARYLKDVNDLKSIKVLHYGGKYEKAWNNYGMNDIVDLWWGYAMQTDWYNKYIYMAIRNLNNQKEKMTLLKEQRCKIFKKILTYIQSENKEVYKSFSKVILYGYDDIGRCFLKELEKNSIEVSCIIDLKDISDRTIPSSVFLKNKEKYADADVIILTLPQHYEQQVRNDIEGKTNIPIISIIDFYNAK